MPNLRYNLLEGKVLIDIFRKVKERQVEWAQNMLDRMIQDIEREIGTDVEESSPTKKLLKALSKEVFTERMKAVGHPRKKKFHGMELTIHTYSMDVDGNDATVEITEIPGELFALGKDDPQKNDDPEGPSVAWRGIGDVPEGQTAFAWNATLTLDPADVGLVTAIAKKMTKMLQADFTSRLGANIIKMMSTHEIDDETDVPIAISMGMFTTTASPEEVHQKLKEAFGIRSILPKTHVKAPWKTPVKKDESLDDLLKKLIF